MSGVAVHMLTGGLWPALMEYAVRGGQLFARWIYVRPSAASRCAGYLPAGFRCVLVHGSAGPRWEGFRHVVLHHRCYAPDPDAGVCDAGRYIAS